jgi:solute carrier family 35 (GDP-fucose transporter), member C1
MEIKPLLSNQYIFSVVAVYWVVSISMVYLNKFLLSNPDASIPAPLFVTWYQCVITCAICDMLGRIGNYTRQSPPSTKSAWLTTFDKYHVTTYNPKVGMKVLPLSLIFVGMITFNNLCLQYVEVSFYNVARSLTIIFSVLFTFFILGEKTQYKTMAVLGIVMLGFLVGIDGEVNFSFLGTCSGVLSSVFVSMNSIYTRKISREIELDNAQLLYYNNFNACVLFIPLMVLFEYNTIYLHAEKLFSVFFWCSMTLTGFVGFAIGLVTVMQVNATSPLTHNISGTAKAGVQSLMAFYIWGNQPTLKGILGIFLVLGGSLAYTYLQRLANEEARKAQKAAKEDSSAVQEGMVTPGKSSDPNYRKNAESNV